MKGVSKLLMLAGILLLAYSVIGKFIGQPTIGFGLVKAKAITGIICANSLLLLSLALKD